MHGAQGLEQSIAGQVHMFKLRQWVGMGAGTAIFWQREREWDRALLFVPFSVISLDGSLMKAWGVELGAGNHDAGALPDF